MEKRFTRTELLLGQEAMKRLRASRVVVFGVGGVGGHVAEVLARSGVGKIALVDPDRVNLSNLNRQIVALHSTVGRLKVKVMAERIRDIHRCHRLQVPVISSMGAANKLNPTAFRVCDISKTSVDPLAKVLRKTLRKEGIEHFKVVYSEEAPSQPPPTGGGVPQNGQESKNPKNICVEEPPPVGGGWRGPLPSCAFVPAACGLVIGGEVVKELAGFAGEASASTL